MAFSVGEEELAGLDTKPLLGHLAAWNYFQSIKDPENAEFIAKWKAFTKNPKRVTNDPMEAHVIGFAMWVKAVEKAKSTDPDKVIDALPGIKAPNLTGGIVEDAAEPPHHQAGVHRRGPGRRPVRRGVEDLGPRSGRRLVDGSRRAPRTSIADWVEAEVRQLQHRRPSKCGGVRLAWSADQ